MKKNITKNQNLDLMNTKELVELFLREEQQTINALKNEKSNIVKTINKVKDRIQKGGRVIYVGSGTSGRIGILDASECRPTFSTDSFLGLIAGGKEALFHAKEGTEDNTRQAIKDLKDIKLSKNDVLVGISASGETPYTVSALKYAKKCRTLTVGITSNPKSTLSRIAHHKISPLINQEIISGSSRLKSGTAQKILLNMISSITMIKSGKVYKNLMIDVEPKNKKLVKRAIGIISVVCKIPLNKATALFKAAKKSTKTALVMHFKKCGPKTAEMLLEKADFSLRKLIG